MAETKTEKKIEREYVIPLRRFWQNVPDYERSGKAIKTIKKFIAKHMKIYDRDLDKIKLDVHMNNEIWFRGRASPPSKIKVKATKENGIVKVELAEMPEFLKFHKARVEKRHQKAEKKQERAANAGRIESYIHNDRVGVLLEIHCETDFVAKADPFRELAHNVAMQIAAMDPETAEDLLAQEFIKDTSMTVEELIKAAIAKLGENIKVGRFVRFEI